MPGGRKLLPQRDAVVRRDVRLVSELAGEAQANEAQRHTIKIHLKAAHVREPSIRKVSARQGSLERRPSFRARDGHCRPLVGNGSDVNLETGPRGLEKKLE